MKTIMTVAGPIPPTSLGFCHCHEHLAISPGRSSEICPALRIDNPEQTLRELRTYRDAEGCGLVDAQPVGCGREATTLSRLSSQSGIHIVAATGFHKMHFYPDDHWIFRLDENELTRLFIEELTSGMFTDGDRDVPTRKSSIKAGIIKCAFEKTGLSNQYGKLFNAAASATLETGAAVMVHIDPGADVIAVADFYAKKGVAPERIAFCHMDRTHGELALHRELAARGIFLEYDTIGRFKYHPDADEARLIARMVEKGFGKNILIGMDATRERLSSYGGEVGLSYLKERFIPALFDHGLEESHITDFTVNNPARYLAMDKSAARNNQLT